MCCILSNTHPTASNSQYQRCSVGKSALEKGYLGSGGKWEKRSGWQVLGAGGRGIVPGFSAQSCLPRTQGHAARLAFGKGWQPLRCSVHPDGSAGSPGSHPLLSTASPLMWKRKGKEIKHEALQQMAAKGASPSPCLLVLPGRFGHSSAGTRNTAG